MGNDPKTSALNSNCQAHECRNLFVTDGGPLVTLRSFSGDIAIARR